MHIEPASKKPVSARLWVGLVVVIVALVMLSIGAGLVLALRLPEAPVQPIEYSHEVHAGQLGLDCQYCHFAARRSLAAGVPPVVTCMGCHVSVKPDSPEVAKLATYWENGERIAWKQISDLPEYVRFNHAPHVRAEVRCQSCHGEIQTMPRVYQAHRFTMGFCLDCHVEKEAPIDCTTCHY